MTHLFSPISLRGLTMDNRIVLSPMCQYAAEDGKATDWHLMHLGGFAVSNVGLIITEATGVEPVGRISPWCLGLYTDEQQEALAKVVRFCREYGSAKFGVQLAHAGRKSSVLPSFMIRRAVPPDEGGWVPISPSYYQDNVHPHPAVMDLELIERVKASWGNAARRAAEIGVDLLELHFAHGYLVNEFLSPLINKRNDAYGGSLDNRMRFALEVFEVCRRAFPAERPIGVRISATDWVEGGWDIGDSIALSGQLKKRGCDYVCTSSGGVSLAQKIEAKPLYQVPFADAVRKGAGIATMAVGQIKEPQQAEDILGEGKADFVALGRGMLSDPRWAWHAAEQLGVFLKYPPRYRITHPRMGRELNFTDTEEKRRKLTAMLEQEEKVGQAAANTRAS